MSESLLLDAATRARLWRQLADIIEQYITQVPELRVTPELAPAKLRALLSRFDFEQPVAPEDAVEFVAKGLTEYQVHTPHPRYFGLFNPAPVTMGIAADALVAAFNPQLAAWSHSPLAAEIEQHVIRAFGSRFGYDGAQTDGTFCSGGAEANHTALLAALTRAFPEFSTTGMRSLPAQPVFYVSSESHHSFLKAARLCGLGAEAVRKVPVDDWLRMVPSALEEAIARDRDRGDAPFLIVATAGTTNAGAIDPLRALAGVAESNQLWYHVDAAWGGAAVLVDELQPLLDGIAAADSITLDAHKWLSVPMGAGMFLTRHLDILDQTFRTETAYMPREARGLDIQDPHLHTMQWSRRFTGLKVFLALTVAGWDGYADAIRHQAAMGCLLRDTLAEAGWRIENETELPVVCFCDPGGADSQEIVMSVVASGEAWISTTVVKGKSVLRACITNYRTQPSDVRTLVNLVSRTRDALRLKAVPAHGGAFPA